MAGRQRTTSSDPQGKADDVRVPRGLTGPRSVAGAANERACSPESGERRGDDLARLASQKLTRFAYIANYTGHDIRKDLRPIIDASHQNNPRDELTGVLVYDKGHFIQLLEGPGHSVTRLMMRILGDPRAEDVAVLFYELVDERALGEFTMLPLRLDVARQIGTLGLQFREAYRQVAKSHDIGGFLKLLRKIIDKAGTDTTAD